MKGKMQGVTLVADWDPKPGFKLGPKDVDGRQTYLGSQVWRKCYCRSKPAAYVARMSTWHKQMKKVTFIIRG